MPPFETHFGLHRCAVSVGHFGAPDRFNYTAIGDGINLTSSFGSAQRLVWDRDHSGRGNLSSGEGKVQIRPLNRVAVKGKTRGITIISPGLVGLNSLISKWRLVTIS
jgi:adenylate cyclase